MRVSTQDGNFPIRMIPRALDQHLSHRLARETRKPRVIRDTALMPASFSKRWDMCQHEDLVESLESVSIEGQERACRLVSELAELALERGQVVQDGESVTASVDSRRSWITK